MPRCITIYLLGICYLLKFYCFVYAINNGYIVAESDGGLANRLRVLIAHMFIAEVLHDKAHLVFIWDVNEACPGHFLQFFKPIPAVTFASNSSRDLLAKNALKVYPPSRDCFSRTMLNYDIDLLVRKTLWAEKEFNLYRNYIVLNREMNDRVNSFLEKHDLCNAKAVHVRKTDMEAELAPKKRTSYQSFFRWVDTYAVNETLYLITDNAESQKVFYERYGSRVIVYANITEVQVPICVANNCNQNSPQNISQLAVDHRFTTLEHAVLDVFIAARCKDMRISAFSSFSELVRMISSIHRPKWCES